MIREFIELLYGIIVFMVTIAGISVSVSRWLKRDVLLGFTIGIGASLFLLYLIVLVLYSFGIPLWLCRFVPVASLLMIVVNREYICEAFHEKDFRAGCLAFLLLAFWSLLHLSYTETFNGGRWSGDYIEHYERALFFIQPLPLDHLFLGRYSFTARPPLANAVYGFFMVLTSPDYSDFQLFCTLTNVLVLFPALLIVRKFCALLGTRAIFPVLLVLLMVNPMVVNNINYSWTRMLCAFYILLGFYHFLVSIKAESHFDRMGAFLSLSVGMLVHYSTGPYIVAFLFLYFVNQKKEVYSGLFWIRTVGIGLVCSLVLLTWIGWSAAYFGIEGTFLSNTSVTDFKDYTLIENLEKVFLNIYNTLVPFTLRGGLPEAGYSQLNFYYSTRDYFFYLYQVSLFPALGMLSGIVLMVHFFPRIRQVLKGRNFQNSSWLAGFLFVIVLGIAVHGGFDEMGLAHICLQPVILLGIILLASVFYVLSKWLRRILICGLIFDYFLGIALHLSLLHIGPAAYLDILQNSVSEQYQVLVEQLGRAVVGNYNVQIFHGVRFLGEQISLNTPVYFLISGILLAGVILWVHRSFRNDASHSGT